MEDKIHSDLEEQRRNCNHDDTYIIDELMFCAECGATVACTCWQCGGEGYTYEDDYHCDWFNYEHRYIVCPDCGGDGWEY